jgi:hypothetical protein
VVSATRRSAAATTRAQEEFEACRESMVALGHRYGVARSLAFSKAQKAAFSTNSVGEPSIRSNDAGRQA